MKCEEITLKCLANSSRQLVLVSNTDLKSFCESLTVVELLFFTKHLQETFVRIYIDCSTLKEHHLQFQLKWHSHCSYFLVSKNSELSDVGLHPSDPLAIPVVSIRSQWKGVCSAHSIDRDTVETFLISFFGSFYDEVLWHCQAVIKPPSSFFTSAPAEDTDDVYYQFGGAAIAAMLKIRYDKIQSSTTADCNNQVSMEISVLQKLSVHLQEEKTHISMYLKYRDEGYMYF